MKKIYLSVVLLFSMLFLFGCKSNESPSKDILDPPVENSTKDEEKVWLLKKQTSYSNLDEQVFFRCDVELYNITENYHYFRITIVPNSPTFEIRDDYQVVIKISSSTIVPVNFKTEEFCITKEYPTFYYASLTEEPQIQMKYSLYCTIRENRV